MALAGTTPMLKEFPPGNHSIRFSCLGFHDTSANIAAVRGKVVRVLGELETEKIEQKTGLVSIVTVPEGATVRNEKSQVIGTTPLTNFSMAKGTHKLSFEKANFISATKDVIVETDRTAQYKFELLPMKDLVEAFKYQFKTGTSKGMIEVAVKKIAAKDYEGAIRVLRKIKKNDEKCIDALFMLGEIYELNLKRYSSANLYYSRYFRKLSEVPAKEQKTGDFKTQMELVEEAIIRVEEKLMKQNEALDKAP